MTVQARASAPIVSPVLRFSRTPKGLLLIVFALLTALAAFHAGFALALPGVVGAMAAAALVDVLLARVVRRAWLFPSGALLSGLIVALVLSSTEPLVVPIATAALAVASKYLLRVRGRHIFNPAALALVAACLLFASGQSWWGALPDLPAPFIVVLLATGVFIANRVNKLPMVLAFLGGYLLLFTLAAFVSDPATVTEIFRTPDISAALFFAFFMLTDPPTSPARYRDQLWFGGIVAGASFAVFLTLGGLYFLPLGLLVGNAWEAWRRATAQGRVRASGRGAVPPLARTLPREADVSSATLQDHREGAALRPRRLLIVERAGYWTEMLAPECARAGYAISSSDPGSIATGVFVSPDVALIDLTGATAEDMAACAALRQSDTSVVAIVRRDDSAMSTAALHAGSTYCLAAPFQAAELFAALRAAEQTQLSVSVRTYADARR